MGRSKIRHNGKKVDDFLRAVSDAGLRTEVKKSGVIMIKHWDGVSLYTYHRGTSGIVKAITALNKWEGVNIPMIK
jgi:hypothetical protein